MDLKKTCSNCNIEQSISNFYQRKHKNIKSYRSECKLCINKRSKIWQETHPEKTKKYGQQYRNQNKKKVNDYKKFWRQKNREKYLEQQRKSGLKYYLR